MEEKETKRPAHRPTIFTDELAAEICSRIAEGESVRAIARDDAMPTMSTIFKWLLDEDKKVFSEQYKFAINVRTEGMAEELQEISDNSKGDVQRDRLRVDTRKWIASRMLPKKYGDKMDLTTDGKALILSFDSSFKDKEDKEDSKEV